MARRQNQWLSSKLWEHSHLVRRISKLLRVGYDLYDAAAIIEFSLPPCWLNIRHSSLLFRLLVTSWINEPNHAATALTITMTAISFCMETDCTNGLHAISASWINTVDSQVGS